MATIPLRDNSTRVDNAPLREAYLAQDRINLNTIANAIGVDESTVRASLGLRKPTQSRKWDPKNNCYKHYTARPNRTLGLARAIEIAEQLGLDPRDIGL